MTSLSSFWPDFLATVGGVLLGIPAGLILNAWIQWIRDSHLRSANRDRLSGTLTDLVVSIDTNERALKNLLTLRPTTAVFGANLDIATWEMALPDVQVHVEPRIYRILLAQYFQDIKELQDLIREYNTFVVGVNRDADNGVTIRIRLADLIHERAGLAIEKGNWLKEQIVEKDGRHTLQTPLSPVPRPHV